MNGGTDWTSQFTAEDIEHSNVASAFAYLIFFLPLLLCSKSPFGKFHANQGLLLFIIAFFGGWVLGLIPILGWILLPFFWAGIVVLAIMGFVNAFNGKAKELPLIGKYRLLKQ